MATIRARGRSTAKGEGDGAAAGAQIGERASSIRWQSFQCQLDQQFGFRARDQGVRRDFQFQRPELAPTEQVRNRLSRLTSVQPGEKRVARSGSSTRSARHAGSFEVAPAPPPAAVRRPVAGFSLTSASRWVAAASNSRRGGTSLGQRRQQIGLVFVDQWIDDRIEMARQHFAELIEGQIDAMVGHSTLREIVGADAFGAVAAPDPQLAGLRLGAGLFFPFRRQQRACNSAIARERFLCWERSS